MAAHVMGDNIRSAPPEDSMSNYNVGDVLIGVRRDVTGSPILDAAAKHPNSAPERFLVLAWETRKASAHNDRWDYVEYTLAQISNTVHDGSTDIAETIRVNDDRIESGVEVRKGAYEVTKTVTFTFQANKPLRYIVREARTSLGWEMLDTGLDCVVGKYDTEGDAQTTADLLNERDAA